MNSFQWKTLSFIGVLGGVVLVALTSAAAQAQTIILRGDQPETTQVDEPNRVSIEYVAPQNPELGELYGRLRDRHALEKIQEILSPFRYSDGLTIKTMECGEVNSWYRRENFKPSRPGVKKPSLKD